MSYLVVSLPEKKKELNGESKGGLDPKEKKRKRKGKQGFLSYHVISMRGWGVSLLSSPNPNPISRTKKEKEKRRRRRKRGEEETIKVFEFTINSR